MATIAFREVLLSLLFVASSALQSPGRGLAATSTCVAFGSLTLLTYGDGHCEAFARANCTIVEEAKDTKVQAIEEWFAAGVCDEAAQSAAADAVVDSIAGVWADAVADVHCDGATSFGCGWALSDPAGWGVSFARMCEDVAQTIVDSGKYPGLEGFCADDFKLIGIDLGSDADTARDEVCAISSSTVVDFHEEYIKLSRQHVLHAIQIAASGVCGEPSEESVCGKEQKPEVIEECNSSVVERCCNSRTISHKMCICARCHNPVRLVEATPRGVWSDSIGSKCFCPSAHVQ